MLSYFAGKLVRTRLRGKLRLAAEIVIVCMLEESTGVIWCERCGLETLTTCMTSGVEFSIATSPPPTSLCCSDNIGITLRSPANVSDRASLVSGIDVLRAQMLPVDRRTYKTPTSWSKCWSVLAACMSKLCAVKMHHTVLLCTAVIFQVFIALVTLIMQTVLDLKHYHCVVDVDSIDPFKADVR